MGSSDYPPLVNYGSAAPIHVNSMSYALIVIIYKYN